MDMSRVSQGTLIAGVGGVLLFISLFLSWASAPAGFGSANAFDLFSGMDIIMLIVSVMVTGIAVATAVGAEASLPTGAAMIVTVLGVALLGFVFGIDIESDNAGIGAWLGLVATIAIVFGGYDSARTPTVASPRRTAPPPTSPPPTAPPTQAGPPPT